MNISVRPLLIGMGEQEDLAQRQSTQAKIIFMDSANFFISVYKIQDSNLNLINDIGLLELESVR